VTRCCRFQLADDDVTKTSTTLSGADVTDDVSALAVDDSSMLAVRKSSHHGYCSSIITRSHRMHSVDAAYCYRQSGGVCLCACVLVTTVSFAKADEPIEMPGMLLR